MLSFIRSGILATALYHVRAESGAPSISAPIPPSNTAASYYEDDLLGQRIRWAAIVDAGSTGTRLFIHEFVFGAAADAAYNDSCCAGEGCVTVFVPGWTNNVKPGLAEVWSGVHADEALQQAAVSDYLRPLLRFLNETLSEKQASQTILYFRCTGGIRQLANNQHKLLNQIRQSVMTEWPVYTRPEFITISSGWDEAVYSWLAANQLGMKFGDGALMVDINPRIPSQDLDAMLPELSAWRVPRNGRQSRQRAGLVEMGGASAQVVLEVPPSHQGLSQRNVSDFHFCNKDYSLYAISLDGCGRQAALNRFLQFLVAETDPESSAGPVAVSCLPHSVTLDVAYERKILKVQGHVRTNATHCRDAVQRFMKKEEFYFPPKFDLGNEYPIYATENYYYFNHYVVADDSAESGQQTPGQQTPGQRGVFSSEKFWLKAQEVCSAPTAADVRKLIHPEASDEKDVSACFGLIFLSEFLKQYVRIPENRYIKARSTIKDIETNFALGVMIAELQKIIPEISTSSTPRPEYNWFEEYEYLLAHDEL